MRHTRTYIRRDGSHLKVSGEYYCAPTAAERMERLADAATLLSWAKNFSREEEVAWFDLNYRMARHAYTRPFEPWEDR